MSTLAGDSGTLKLGYHVAVTLASWTVTRQIDSALEPATLTAIVSWTNAYYSTQRPLVVGLWMSKIWWVWRNVEVEGDIDAGTALTARLIGEPIALIDF